MNEVVRIHNDFTDLPLKQFTASEMDILMAICHECQDKQTNEVAIPFEKVRALADYRHKEEKDFIKSIENANKKLMALNFRIGTDRVFTQFVLFPQFIVNADEGTLKVKVNEPFAYILNDLNFYTSSELKESASLKSAYSKQIYKKLKRFRSTGMWKVRFEDFVEFLDIPLSYSPSDVDKRITAKALEELSPYFQRLKCKKWYKKPSGQRGRPSVAGYIWTFSPEQHEKQLAHEPTQEGIAKLTGWKKTSRYCPVCKRQIYEKLMENEDGLYRLYGHTDFKTGDCRYTTYDFADLLQKHQIEQQGEVNQEDVAKLLEIGKSLFK